MNLCESLGVSWGLWASLASSLRERLGQIPGPPIGWGHRGSVPTWSSVGTPHWLAQSAGASLGWGLGTMGALLGALLGALPARLQYSTVQYSTGTKVLGTKDFLIFHIS